MASFAPAAQAKRRVLNVSSSDTVRDTRDIFLSNAGYAVISVQNVENAMKLLASQQFDAVIVAASSRGREQEAQLRQLRVNAREHGARVLLLSSGLAQMNDAAEAQVD